MSKNSGNSVLYPLNKAAHASFGMCGRCCENNLLFKANCFENPELLAGNTLEMYHCPDCGAMVMAGVQHPMMCERCLGRKHPLFDKQNVKGEHHE